MNFETLELWLKYPSKTQDIVIKPVTSVQNAIRSVWNAIWAYQNNVDSFGKCVSTLVASGTQPDSFWTPPNSFLDAISFF
jgi:hypothetical protein